MPGFHNLNNIGILVGSREPARRVVPGCPARHRRSPETRLRFGRRDALHGTSPDTFPTGVHLADARHIREHGILDHVSMRNRQGQVRSQTGIASSLFSTPHVPSSPSWGRMRWASLLGNWSCDGSCGGAGEPCRGCCGDAVEIQTRQPVAGVWRACKPAFGRGALRRYADRRGSEFGATQLTRVARACALLPTSAVPSLSPLGVAIPRPEVLGFGVEGCGFIVPEELFTIERNCFLPSC